MQILGGVDPTVSAPLTAPTTLSAIPTDTNVAISFTAPTNDGGSAITNYEYSFNNSSWTALSPADAVSPVTVSGLTQNTSYTVYLRGVNIVGSGPASSGVTFTTAGVPTGTTTISGVTVTTTTATVSFSTTAGGSAITGYDYYLTSWVDASTTTSPKTISGLSSNTSYTVYMRPKNAYGSGSQSAGVGFTTSAVFMSATGGTTNTYSNYKSHIFTGNSSLVVSVAGDYPTADILVVGGGAGGGNDRGGGGGAGGFRTSSQTLTATTYTVTVGGAGSGGVYGGATPTAGGNSIFYGPTTISSTGGGRGSQCCYSAAGSGGSGGGANPGSGYGTGNAGGYSPVEGYRGGNSSDGWMGAGGGGATAVGTDNSYGAGGAGASNAYYTGSNITYANGGAGMPTTGNSGNYGAGGGGGTAGVQGVVVVRYRVS